MKRKNNLIDNIKSMKNNIKKKKITENNKRIKTSKDKNYKMKWWVSDRLYDKRNKKM